MSIITYSKLVWGSHRKNEFRVQFILFENKFVDDCKNGCMNKIIKYLFVISALFFLSLFASTTVFAGTGNVVSGSAINTASASSAHANNLFQGSNILQELHSAQDALHDKITSSLNTISKNSFQLTSFPQEPASVAYVLNGEMLSDFSKTVFSVYQPTLSFINKTQKSFTKTVNDAYTASSNQISKLSRLPKEPASVAYVLNGEMLSDFSKTAVWTYNSVLSLFNKKEDNVFVENNNIGGASSLSIISSASTSTSTKVSKPVAVKTATGNTTIINPIKEKVVEKTIIKTVSGVSKSDLQNISDKLNSEIQKVAQAFSTWRPEYRAIVLSNNVKNVDAATISNSTISGSIISGSTFSGSTLSLTGALTGTTGVFSGNLSTAKNLSVGGQLLVSGIATSTISGDVAFDTDTLYVDSLNNRVGIGTTSPTDTLSVNGATYLASITPTDTTSRLYNSSGNLYWSGNLIGGASTGSWDTDGTSVWRVSGNVGISTTSPSAPLSVSGSGYLTGGLGVGLLNTTAGTLQTSGNATIGGNLTVSGTLNTTGNTTLVNASTTLLSVVNNFWSNGTTNIGNADADALNIRAGDWNLTSTATTTVAMTNGINFDSNTLVVDPNSNRVGIGTTSPSEKLDVNGNINIADGDYYKYGGSNALRLAKGTDAFYANTFVGLDAGNAAATRMTAVGYNAGNGNTGIYSNAFGGYALQQNTGDYSNGFGYAALYQNTGTNSNAIGRFALQQNTGANSNAVGSYALSKNTGTNSNAFGQTALYQNTGTNSNVFGNSAGSSNTGNNIIGIGYQALYNNSGSNIVAIGY
ncbi:hypothetical protein MNBD_CPR01-49, partial [hydrothermal vent metagenome]